MGDDSNALRAVERGLAVLEALAQPGAPMSMSEIAGKVGFSRAAVRRIVLTLCDLGYVAESEPNRYAPQPHVLRLGWQSLAVRSLADLARPAMMELSEATGQVSVLARRFQAEIVIEAVVSPNASNVFHVAVGDRLAPLTSDAGRLLFTAEDLGYPTLAALLQDSSGPHVGRFVESLSPVGSDAYCLVDQEMEPGLMTVGVRVRGRGDAIVASLSLFADVGNSTQEGLREAVPALKRASQRMQLALKRGAAAFAV